MQRTIATQNRMYNLLGSSVTIRDVLYRCFNSPGHEEVDIKEANAKSIFVSSKLSDGKADE